MEAKRALSARRLERAFNVHLSAFSRARRCFRVVSVAMDGVSRRMKVAFISGTSIVNSTLFSSFNVKTLETKYDQVTYKNRGDFALINRHVYSFPLPPHSINYRANISALGQLGFKDIVSLNSVGSL